MPYEYDHMTGQHLMEGDEDELELCESQRLPTIRAHSS